MELEFGFGSQAVLDLCYFEVIFNQTKPRIGTALTAHERLLYSVNCRASTHFGYNPLSKQFLVLCRVGFPGPTSLKLVTVFSLRSPQ